MTRCCGAVTVVTQARCPSTVLTGRFSLLCFQPEALLDSLAARTSLATERHPCGMGTWRGRSINVLSATSRNWFMIHQPSPHMGDRHARPHPATSCSLDTATTRRNPARAIALAIRSEKIATNQTFFRRHNVAASVIREQLTLLRVCSNPAG